MAPTCYMATLSHYAAAAYHVRQKKQTTKIKLLTRLVKKILVDLGHAYPVPGGVP